MTDLAAVREIEQLKYRYVRCLDTKDWDGFAACLLPDATADYAGLEFPDREALVGYLRESLGAGVVTLHHVHHPEIDVDGDLATGRWALEDRVLAEAFDFCLEGAAYYEDRYRRTDDGWRIAHTGYRRTFEASWQPSGLPGWRLVTDPRPHA